MEKPCTWGPGKKEVGFGRRKDPENKKLHED